MRKNQRRRFLLASSALLAVPLTSFAQPAPKVRRIGYLSLAAASTEVQQFWRDSLRRAGYEEGRNLVIEWRFAEGEVGRLAGLADELVRLNVELIVAYLNEATDAAKHATQTIPIVMFAGMFPVERGIVKSLAHPGGNVTGTVWYANPQETSTKMLQIIKDAVPKARRLSQLWNPADPQMRFYDFAQRERVAAALGMSQQRFGITRPDEQKAAIGRVAASRPDVLWVGGNVNAVGVFREIAAFAIERKLVSVSDSALWVEAGGLLSYGPDRNALRDRTVSYVDRMLRGAKPSDLPVEQTTKWEMLLNAKTARAIGFKPPPSFMLRVDREIE